MTITEEEIMIHALNGTLMQSKNLSDRYIVKNPKGLIITCHQGSGNNFSAILVQKNPFSTKLKKSKDPYPNAYLVSDDLGEVFDLREETEFVESVVSIGIVSNGKFISKYTVSAVNSEKIRYVCNKTINGTFKTFRDTIDSNGKRFNLYVCDNHDYNKLMLLYTGALSSGKD